jgi:short-subunit dehydrogenase
VAPNAKTMNFQNKTIWITGASSGIGQALAYEWAKFGSRIILSGRNTKSLEKVKASCEKLGAECIVVQLDLTVDKTIQKAISIVKEKYNKVDILINNGGISQRSMAIETPLEVDRTIMETNFFGAVNLTKRVLPIMVENGGGHIVVISSVVGKFGFPLRTAYSASKHALQGYFDSLRAEMTPDNINITMVSPGRIQTNISVNAIDKDGEKHGVMDPGQAQGMPVEKCAKKIVKAVSRNKKDILIGNKELLMVYIRKYIPGLYYKMASKVKPT